jgi:hypothetical protein
LPKAPDYSSDPKEEDGKSEIQLHTRQRPVLGGNQRLAEYAPAVNRAQADLHDDRGNGN